MSQSPFLIQPIGQVQASTSGYRLAIEPAFRPGLQHVDQFSHLMVFWWANQHDNEASRNTIQTQLPYANNLTAGVFACRSEFRPNPIAVTIVDVLGVDQTNGTISIPYIDAFDQTPIIDLKPYIPVNERVRQVRVPQWFADWPDWYEDAAVFFSANAARLFGAAND